MTMTSIYDSIAQRTQGDIYIGIVGPVRTGKSTFIKSFMDKAVLPNIDNQAQKQRAKDELPQSASGKTIMTTEPKFVPEKAVEISVDDSASFRVRLIDCVGYVVPGSLGYIENGKARMVKTPWFDKEIPFNLAAEVGTQKVIKEHSTVGLVITTDGSISELSREDYTDAEERVINELKELDKPFLVLLNSNRPESKECRELARALSERYEVNVIPVNCLELDGEKINGIISELLYEFPIKEMRIDFPKWISGLEKEHEIRKSIYDAVRESAKGIVRMRDSRSFADSMKKSGSVNDCTVTQIDLSDGCVNVRLAVDGKAFYKVLSEKTGLNIANEQELMKTLVEFTKAKKEFDRFADALKEVETTGYGIVMPTMEELSLEEPEIMRQGGRYGVRLKASAPSIHMLKADITTEVAPIVGSESQSEELIMYLLKEFEEDPAKIWESNIFGKSLNSLVNEGLHNKLYKMPSDARMKIQETLERVINEGCSGLICIIL